MRVYRIFDRNPTGRPDHGHDPAPKPGAPRHVNAHLALEPRLESIDQCARSSQSGELDSGPGTKFEDRTERQDFEIQTGRQYVFTEITRPQVVAIGAQKFEKLGGNQMDLAQVGHSVPRQISMTDDRPSMDISFDSQPSSRTRFSRADLLKR
jgi:hypothetical protein